MAKLLGVTAPALNKWENRNSQPDIMLLAPIARLLDITIDTLLSFKEEATPEEINNIIREADNVLKLKTYEEAFEWATDQINQFPNSEQLIWQIYLLFLSREDPERKRKQAVIYSKTNRQNEAYKTYEELLFSGYQMMNMVLNSIYIK